MDLKERAIEEPRFSWGWFWRSIRPDLLWALVGFGAFGLVGLAAAPRDGFFGSRVSCLLVVMLFLVCHLFATVFHYLPRGAEQGMARLSLAAFCRTFLPLLALMAVHHYIFPLLDGTNLAGICTSYLLSLGLTIASALRGSAAD